MNYLIGLGFEKCATTEFHAYVSKISSFSVPERKELFFFNRDFDKGLEFYNKYFPQGEEVKYRIDITPSYIRNEETLNRIANFSENHDTKFLIFLRNPIKRAFSHYVHDLRNHHLNQRGWIYANKEQFEEVYDKSFFDNYLEENKYYFTKYADTLKRIFNKFGKDNVLTLILEKDFLDLNVLSHKISEFIGLEVNFERPMLRSNYFKTFPFYYYSFSKPAVFYAGNEKIEAKPNTLYSYNGKILKTYEIDDHNKLAKIFYSYSKWTSMVPESFVQTLLNDYFLEDINEVEKILNVDLIDWKKSEPIRY